MKRSRITITGQVQGVGFRPFVYREAHARNLSGYVGNHAGGVEIEAQGDEAALASFVLALQNNLPALARITSLRETPLPVIPHEKDFFIQASPAGGATAVLVSPDVATCDDCLRELFDPNDRRYLYPFINCTNCGPRFTLTRSVPYDRAVTSMACFPLCPDCAREYKDPADRRFHAQPDACPACGPRLWLAKPGGDTLPPADCGQNYVPHLRGAARALVSGAILAMKSLGGFHLVCDARNEEVVAELRRRKQRPHKALAVMVADVPAARSVARLTEADIALLTSRARPIVLAAKSAEPDGKLPACLAPDVPDIGIMLPYTPLHHVLFAFVREESLRKGDSRPPVLVMTSGNRQGEPICLGNREALSHLGGIADLFLLHDRDILVRADDSVLRALPDGPQFIRRARGYTPSPLPLPPEDSRSSVLAMGADLKNTCTLTRGADAFVSQYIGDLSNPSVENFAEEAEKHLEHLLGVDNGQIRAVVCDAHPDYLSVRLAEQAAEQRRIPLFRLQHHAAHLFAVLAEHHQTGPALGLILDGTGYGTDGAIWGGELLFAEGGSWKRLGRLSPFPLPGGEAAIREPWRIACGFLTRHNYPRPALPGVDPALYEAVAETVRAGFGIPTSSCGRLFDAASALLGLCERISYEGQAAIRLESAQDDSAGAPLPCVRQTSAGLFELDSDSLLLDLAEGIRRGVPAAELARRFHLGLVAGLAELVRQAAPPDVRTIALGGGVFLNRTMAVMLTKALTAQGFVVLRNVSLPPGDGAISYGQTAWFIKNFCPPPGTKNEIDSCMGEGIMR